MEAKETLTIIERKRSGIEVIMGGRGLGRRRTGKQYGSSRSSAMMHDAGRWRGRSGLIGGGFIDRSGDRLVRLSFHVQLNSYCLVLVLAISLSMIQSIS